jgi:hypothetical protein
MRIWSLGSWLTWMATMGSATVPDQLPVAAGFPGLALLKVTVTGAAYPVAPAPLKALAPSEWVPLGNFVVSREKAAGLAVAGVPTAALSTRSCTAWMPEGALAMTLTMAVPVSVAPSAGQTGAGGYTKGDGSCII